jgi:hypothetical protein
MLIPLLLLLVLIFAVAGFALHNLWIVAVVFLVVWLIGVALGRGESAETTSVTSGNSGAEAAWE